MQRPSVLHKRKISGVSVGDIMMERSQRIENFINTRQLTLLDMPTTLPDVFEFMNAVSEDPQVDIRSTLWRLLQFLNFQDMINLRLVCRSSAQLMTPQAQLLAINLGMLGDLRSVFWQTQCQCKEIDTHLQMKMSIGSVFADLYEEMR